MKYLYAILLSLALAVPAYAATNQPTVLEEATKTAKTAIATNLNEVIVDILRGVKSAGGEVYAASKTAITKSVDFTMEQAPLVVKEFLRWKIAQAVIWLSVFMIMVGCILYFAHRLVKAAPASRYYKEDHIGFAWFLRVVACLIFIIAIGFNGMTITKIAIAPRVYLIEYVVDTLQGNNAQHR